MKGKFTLKTRSFFEEEVRGNVRTILYDLDSVDFNRSFSENEEPTAVRTDANAVLLRRSKRKRHPPAEDFLKSTFADYYPHYLPAYNFRGKTLAIFDIYLLLARLFSSL